MRAAAFGLGALLYVVEAGRADSLRQISSVSGGSITNAFVANTWTNDSPVDSKALQTLGRRLATNGAPLESLGRQIGTYLMAVNLSLVFSIGLSILIFILPSKVSWAQELSIVLVIYLLYWDVVFSAMLRTMVGAMLSVWLQAMINPVDLPAKKRKNRALPMLRVLLAPTQRNIMRLVSPERPGVVVRKLSEMRSPVFHVITATDLKHGEQLHFSNLGILSKAYGLTDRGDVRLDEAVRASAAFPGGIPPTRIAFGRLSLPQEVTVYEKYLVLVDGGVRDNLGHAFDSYVVKSPGVVTDTLAPSGATSFVIVVDASAPRGVADLSQNMLSKIPVVRKIPQVTLFPRVVGVMNQSNSEARALALASTLQSTHQGVVVSIKQSPVDICESALNDPRGLIGLDSGGGLPAADINSQTRLDRATVASNALSELPGFGRAEWNGLVVRNARTPTTLSSLGDERIAELVMHGYVSTMCSAHIEKDWPLLPNDSWSSARFARWLRPATVETQP